MSFMMYDTGRTRRRQGDRRRKIMFGIFLFAGVCGFFYWLGGEAVRTSEVAYKQQAMELRVLRGQLEGKITSLQSEVQAALLRYQQLETQFKQDVPQGDFKRLTDLVKKRLDGGIKPERLEFIIDSAKPPKNCIEPQAKRFVVKTPVYGGPHGTVAFGNGAITVTGEGQSAVDAGGKAEAWYDPGKEVTIKFIEIGGKETVKTGLMPLQHSMVLGNKEYRFTIAAGERSFMSVTSDSCDYP